MVHGLGLSGRYFGPVARKLAATGHSVVVPDLPGHVRRLRAQIIPQALADMPGAWVLVGGMTAAHRDLSDETAGKLWPVLGLVLGLSFVFLVAVFRSILVPSRLC
ncbi:hypothetical protein VR41_10985 [Streptomyces sp. NRRL B-1568]|nr:hypothetical protein VR41_10985 [Streptomyces sp. NRRL B-1568]